MKVLRKVDSLELMRKPIYIVILLACSLVGCRPHDILSRRQMQTVLIDLHKAEAVMQVSGYSTYAYADVETKAYYITLQKHNLTQAQFDSSLVWYTKHPQLFDKIYPKVLAQLEAEQDTFNLAHPSIYESHKPQSRVLPDLDKMFFESAEGMVIDWLDSGEKYKKIQKSKEKFVYIKIN